VPCLMFLINLSASWEKSTGQGRGKPFRLV
jgi:hypothetical protein